MFTNISVESGMAPIKEPLSNDLALPGSDQIGEGDENFYNHFSRRNLILERLGAKRRHQILDRLSSYFIRTK